MHISFRQKIAGKAEAKKVTGLNFEEIKRKLIFEGIEPTSEEIKSRLLDDSNLVISNLERELILNLNLSEQSRRRVNELEAALIIIGAVLSENNENGIIEDFNWYLETMELKPGNLSISLENISNISAIKESFEKLYTKVLEEKTKSEEISKESYDDSYLSNEVVYNEFGDGWRVVYVPAAGEMQSFPGLSGTSYDRILEGNKNGLCLGAGRQYYQDNNQGKIYSVRDPENKPRVTIRIHKNELLEAKGKNNNPPDILAAEKANIWFESIDSLNYKENGDYNLFPPLKVENAKQSFLEDKNKAYSAGWAPHWYKKGVGELDEDIDIKISENDPMIIEGGFGKYPAFFEKIKPVVIYWCNSYLNGDTDARAVLFGNRYGTNHEVFKTYKKLNEMSLAVKKLSEDEYYSSHFFKLKLHKIKEYEKYIYKPSKKFVSEKPKEFLKDYSEEPWAQIYLDDCVAKLVYYNSRYDDKEFVITELFNKSFAKEYMSTAVDSMIYSDAGRFLSNLYKYNYINTLDSDATNKIIDQAFKNLDVKDMILVLKSSNDGLDTQHDDRAFENKEKFDKILINKLSENIEYIKKLFSISSFGKSIDIIEFCAQLPLANYLDQNDHDYNLAEELLDIVYKKSVYTNDFAAIFAMGNKIDDFINKFYENNIRKKLKLISLSLLKNLSSNYIPEEYLEHDIWFFIKNMMKYIRKDNIVYYGKLIINNIKKNNPLFFLEKMYFRKKVEKVNDHYYFQAPKQYLVRDGLYDIFEEELSTIPDKEILYNRSKKDGANVAKTMLYMLNNEDIIENNKVDNILFEVFEKNYKEYINKLNERDLEILFKNISTGRIKGYYIVNFFKNKNNLEILINKYFISGEMKLLNYLYQQNFPDSDKGMSELSISLRGAIRDGAENILKIYNDRYEYGFLNKIENLFNKEKNIRKSVIFNDNLELLKQYIGLYDGEKKTSSEKKSIKGKKLIKLSNIIIGFDKEEAKNIYKLTKIFGSM